MADFAGVLCDARQDGEDVTEWLEGVAMRAVTIDHMKRSPLCRNGKADIKFPIPTAGTPVGSGQ